MAHDNDISCQMRQRQVHLRMALDRRGIALKAVSAASGISYSTLLSYFPLGRDAIPAVMPLTALVQLFGVIPDELLSILTEPEGRCFAAFANDDDGLKELMDAREKLDAAITKRQGGR
ncbi:hypothetical protein [Novosphingobium sediminicola]|uniref:Transcriptional regulator with XRE-family HTH domain n=1 Tax=Novosphingobium sediminicola TaxID=563162 RepID=A0A7W6G9A4_9SPHN|nr:hypothetical protein [Novosphingobium sediminicola]MBB3956862.1 transcriptional regulator with XRE-family HTH domain [Novosphingobium sediminicola]